MDRPSESRPDSEPEPAPAVPHDRVRPSPFQDDQGAVALPRSVLLAIRAAWALVGVMGVTVVLMAVFYDDVIGAWAEHHDGARQAFAQGGRSGLERAGFAPPSFLPVGVTMVVVVAMIVWVLTVFLRHGYRWGQLGLLALVLACAYAGVALGLLSGPPPVFVVMASVSLLVDGVTVTCLWHADTRAHVRGPWTASGAGEAPGGPASRAV